MDTMNLNERAAKCMGWTVDYMGNYRYGLRFVGQQDGRNKNTDAQPTWNPSEDYNHARMLYQLVVERNLEGNLLEVVLAKSCYRPRDHPYEGAALVLRLTPAQFTEACCEALEAHDDPS